jgi:hypothetical protein
MKKRVAPSTIRGKHRLPSLSKKINRCLFGWRIKTSIIFKIILLILNQKGMYEKKTYGKCSFCGADRVKNPKTGKIFCSDKCWTKSKSPSELKNRPERGETGRKVYDTTPATATELPDEFQT